MSVLDELAVSCRRRGLRLGLVGETRDGSDQPGLYLIALEVRSRGHELVACEPVDGFADDLELETVAFALAERVVEALS